VDGSADGSQCLVWGCKRALGGFEFLFISHSSVLVLPAKVHGKLDTKPLPVQEKGSWRGGTEFFVLALIWCLSAHG